MVVGVSGDFAASRGFTSQYNDAVVLARKCSGGLSWRPSRRALTLVPFGQPDR
jgi:hypothetical protein